MSEKLIAFVTTACALIQVYCNSILNAEQIEQAAKRTLTTVIILSILGGVILLSTWLSLQVLLFFYLLSLNITNLQAVTIILGIDFLVLLIVLLWLLSAKKRIARMRNVSFLMLLNYLIAAAKDSFR
jgi:hypothetical protein